MPSVYFIGGFGEFGEYYIGGHEYQQFQIKTAVPLPCYQDADARRMQRVVPALTSRSHLQAISGEAPLSG